MPGLGHLPSTENLQCFLAAASHLNFTRAAEQLAITPTAFGQRIKQLEEQLGCSLFRRTTRRVELTEEGLRLRGQAQTLVEQALVCVASVHEDGSAPAHFSIGTRFELGLSWLVPSIEVLRDQASNWDIDLYFGAGPDILAQLEAGRVDAIVSSAPVANAGWEAEFLHREDYLFVASTELLKERPFRNTADAKLHTLIDVDRDLPLTRYLMSARPDLEFGDLWLSGAGAAVAQLVSNGRGVAVLPEYMVREDLKTGGLTRLLPETDLLHDSFRLMFRSASPHASTLRKLASILRERPLQ